MSNEATASRHPEVHFTKTNGACQSQRPVEQRDECVPRCWQSSGTKPLSTFGIRTGVVSLDYSTLHPSGPKHHQSYLSHTWSFWQTYWHNTSDLSRKKGSLGFLKIDIISCQGSIYETILIWYLIIRQPVSFHMLHMRTWFSSLKSPHAPFLYFIETCELLGQMKHWGWNWRVSAVKMADHNWSAQVLKWDRASAVQSHGSGINPTAINRFHWTLLREWEEHLHPCIPLLFFFPWKRGAKISSLTLLPVLITSVLMSCTPSVKCTSPSLF